MASTLYPVFTSGKAPSRLLLFSLAAATSLFSIERAAADCILTAGAGTATTPGTGARVTCQAAGGPQGTPVVAEVGSTDVQVTLADGTTFDPEASFSNALITVRSNSLITNNANIALHSPGGEGFIVNGDNSTVINNGSLETLGQRSNAILITSGAGNTVINNGTLNVLYNLNAGVRFESGTQGGTFINNGSIISRIASFGHTAVGADIQSDTGETTLTINRGIIDSSTDSAVITGSGRDRVENYGTLIASNDENVRIIAAANLGAGNDTYVIGGNSSVNTWVEGGSGTDILEFGVDSGTLNVGLVDTEGRYRGFERLEKIGNAEWTLTGATDRNLPVTVSAGQLFLDAEMLGAPVTVSNGATLSGTGSVGALDVASGGTVAPAGRGALGVFTAASVTFAAGSSFRVRVNDQGGSDRLQVNGVATINGGRVNVDVSGGYAVNTPYRILTATSLAGPRFQSATASLALLQPVLSYDATNVYVTFQRTTQPPPDNPDEPDQPDNPTDPVDPDDPVEPDNPPVITLDQVGRTWNQISTGRALESQGMTGPLLPVVLAQPTIPDVLRALDLLSGEPYATAVGVASGDTETIHRALLTRLRTASPTGPAPGATPLAYAPAVSKAPFPSAPRSPALMVDLWGQGFGSWGSRESRGGLGVASIERTTGGFILGAETRFDTTWRIGMAGAYTQTSFELAERLSSGSLDSYHAALYGSGTVRGFALRGGATYTRHELDIDRAAVMRGFSGEAHGSLSLDSAGLFAEIGYPVQFGRLTAEPVASLSYVHTGSGSFTEDGNAMALRGRTDTFGTTWTTLGVRLSGDLTDDGRLKAHGLLGWRHAFGDRLPTTVNQFITGSDPFLIIGNPIDQDSLVIETGLDWFVTPAVALGVRYDGQYGAHDSSQSLRGQFTARF